MAVSLSQSQLRLISAIGMGVLVGTSLIVIIPEGIETIYNAPKTSSTAVGMTNAVVQARGVNLDWAVLAQRDIPEGAPSYLWTRNPEIENTHTHTHTEPDVNAPGKPEHHHDEKEEAPHKWVGLSLIAGFLLMYLIDVLPSHARSSQDPQPYHIAIDNLRGSMSSSTPPSPHLSKPSAMTLGLVIHAAADGIALGASSASQNLALGAIIFLAIMLHKAPAAFGLTAVLLRGGLGKRQVRGHLLVFSLAAPVGALVTWILLALLGGDLTGEGADVQWWTGVLLLFSGGTFLWVPPLCVGNEGLIGQICGDAYDAGSGDSAVGEWTEEYAEGCAGGGLWDGVAVGDTDWTSPSLRIDLGYAVCKFRIKERENYKHNHASVEHVTRVHDALDLSPLASSDSRCAIGLHAAHEFFLFYFLLFNHFSRTGAFSRHLLHALSAPNLLRPVQASRKMSMPTGPLSSNWELLRKRLAASNPPKRKATDDKPASTTSTTPATRKLKRRR